MVNLKKDIDNYKDKFNSQFNEDEEIGKILNILKIDNKNEDFCSSQKFIDNCKYKKETKGYEEVCKFCCTELGFCLD